MSTQTLYRYWQGETLLYVGISVDAYTRATSHKRSAGWWPQADRMTMEHFSTRQDVMTAEKLAIREEQPLYNKTFNSREVITRVQHIKPKHEEKPSEQLTFEQRIAKRVEELSKNPPPLTDRQREVILSAFAGFTVNGGRA